jgi:hypothetical protein
MKGRARRDVRAALGAVTALLPNPWDIDAFVNRLAQHRDRPIALVPWTFEGVATSTSGMFLPSASTDYVFYAAAASPARREQIIGHELGHLLLGHNPQLQDAPDGLLQALAPDVSPALARRVLALARTGYDDAHEAAAELFGTSLTQLGAAAGHPPEDGELGRLVEVLR